MTQSVHVYYICLDTGLPLIPCHIDIVAQEWEAALCRCSMGCQQAFNTGTTSVTTTAPSGPTWPLCPIENREDALGQTGISATSPHYKFLPTPGLEGQLRQ